MSLVSISLPTLGMRPKLLIATLNSLAGVVDLQHLEICTPNKESVTQALNGTVFQDVVVVQDGADQANSILNSWQRNPSKWYAWINDDDLANPMMSETVNQATRHEFVLPTVCYGDFGILNETTYRRVKTPLFLTHNMLRYGGNYVPGLMTFLNHSAVEILNRHRHENHIYRDSFDYQWWLELSKQGTKFQHIRGNFGYWRDHAFARTVEQHQVGTYETQALRQNYQDLTLGSTELKIRNFIYKALSKILSI